MCLLSSAGINIYALMQLCQLIFKPHPKTLVWHASHRSKPTRIVAVADQFAPLTFVSAVCYCQQQAAFIGTSPSVKAIHGMRLSSNKKYLAVVEQTYANDRQQVRVLPRTRFFCSSTCLRI
jgi:hypothetical protein